MASETENNKFDWNEVVIVKTSAPDHFHPGEVAFVCGMTRVEFEDIAKKYHTNIGEWIYTIEFKDGSDINIPEYYLVKGIDSLTFSIGNFVIMKKNIDISYHPSETLRIVDYHKISDSSLAKKFNLAVGDIIYVGKPEKGEEILIPESFIEKKTDSYDE